MIDKQRLGTFVLGGAVGVLVSILLTPRSGREIRGSIANRAGEARDRGRESYFETQERLRERLAEMGEGELRQPTDTEEVSIGSATEPVRESPFDPGSSDPRFGGLRDVSREGREEFSGEPADDRSEELRRKVRETRNRLRQRTEGPDDGHS